MSVSRMGARSSHPLAVILAIGIKRRQHPHPPGIEDLTAKIILASTSPGLAKALEAIPVVQLHCDFIRLHQMLVRTYMEELRGYTNDVLYENWRTD
jgi:hypothetical protein